MCFLSPLTATVSESPANNRHGTSWSNRPVRMFQTAEFACSIRSLDYIRTLYSFFCPRLETGVPCPLSFVSFDTRHSQYFSRPLSIHFLFSGTGFAFLAFQSDLSFHLCRLVLTHLLLVASCDSKSVRHSRL